MNHDGLHRRKVITRLFSLLLITLSPWNPFRGGFSALHQQDQPTATASPTLTTTLLSSETITPTASETATLAVAETQTTTVPASATSEVTSTNSPVPTVSLSGDFVSDEILIRFRRRASQQTIESCVQSANALVEEEIDELDILRIKVSDGDIAKAIPMLSACPDVRYVEPNYRVSIADTIPSDPDWTLQYGLTNIRAPQGWDISTGSASVTIAILDTGVDLGHLDLAPKIVPGYDFVNNDANAQDDNGHGTHVAGIAAAASNNSLGIAGVSWGARIMPIKILNASGNGTFANVAAGIIWATDRGAQVINMSFGGNNPSQVLQDAVNYADSKGVVLVGATGNEGNNSVLYPARYPQVIAVAATDGSNGHAGFSNYGPEVDLSAPGQSVYSTLIGGYGYSSGTSMSAPFVSGLAAILRGIPGNGSPAVIAFQMESTALDLGAPGIDDFHGYGLIQMDAALRAALSLPTATFTATSISPPTLTFTAAPPSIPQATLPTVAPSTGSAPTATPITPSPSLELPTMSPTSFSLGTSPADSTESPDVFALETPTPAPAQQTRDWIIPCLGTLLILLGIFLFWMARRSSQSLRKIKHFK